MFSLSFYKCVLKYSIIIVLLKCLIPAQAVENWNSDDHFNSGRKLLSNSMSGVERRKNEDQSNKDFFEFRYDDRWQEFYKEDPEKFEWEDNYEWMVGAAFGIMLLLIFIFFTIYLCEKGYCGDLPVSQENARRSDLELNVAFTNTDSSSPGGTDNQPPDYAAVILAQSGQTSYPRVQKEVETPPPLFSSLEFNRQ